MGSNFEDVGVPNGRFGEVVSVYSDGVMHAVVFVFVVFDWRVG